MKTIVTNIDFLVNNDLSSINAFEKSDKLYVLYDKTMDIPIDVCILLVESKIKPAFIESPNPDGAADAVELSYFRLGTLLSGMMGTVILLMNDETIKKLDGFCYENGSIKVCSNVKDALKVADKAPLKQKRTRISRKTASVDIKSLYESFAEILSECDNSKINLDAYKGQILVAIQESDEWFDVINKIILYTDDNTGNMIYESIHPRYNELKNIASQLPVQG